MRRAIPSGMPETNPGMTSEMTVPNQSRVRPLDPRAVKAMLGDGDELALVDLREELVFSRNHLLWARSIPLSRLELRFARLVPRLSTRIVLCDDGDGLVERAAAMTQNAREKALLLGRAAEMDGASAEPARKQA